MNRNRRIHAIAVGAILLTCMLVTACTPPVCHHSFLTKYNAEGAVIGYEETESITQQSPSSSSMKVRIDRRDKLED
jgi:hypothetical protein